MSGAIRLLNDMEKVERFVEDAIGIKSIDNTNFPFICRNILDAELALAGAPNQSTLKNDKFREGSYRSENSRTKLRRIIVEELLTQKRPEDDNQICLGLGGALPKSGVVNSDGFAYIIIGLPASGKSGVSEMIADKYNAVIVDSDFAKRKFPEYEAKCGANLTHDESVLVTFGDSINEPSVLSECISERYNIVIPKTGYETESIRDLAKMIKKFGYQVHLILVRLDRKKAVLRAYSRFALTGRYVPLSLIYDGYANDPTITYYDLKKEKRLFTSYEMVSSDVDLGKPLRILEKSKYAPIDEKDLQK